MNSSIRSRVPRLPRLGILRDGPCARNVLHDEVRQGPVIVFERPRLEYLGDAGVAQVAENLRFIFESPRGGSREQAALHHLHGDGPVRTLLDGFVDRSHAAGRDRALQVVVADFGTDESGIRSTVRRMVDHLEVIAQDGLRKKTRISLVFLEEFLNLSP